MIQSPLSNYQFHIAYCIPFMASFLQVRIKFLYVENRICRWWYETHIPKSLTTLNYTV